MKLLIYYYYNLQVSLYEHFLKSEHSLVVLKL